MTYRNVTSRDIHAL